MSTLDPVIDAATMKHVEPVTGQLHNSLVLSEILQTNRTIDPIMIQHVPKRNPPKSPSMVSPGNHAMSDLFQAVYVKHAAAAGAQIKREEEHPTKDAVSKVV